MLFWEGNKSSNREGLHRKRHCPTLKYIAADTSKNVNWEQVDSQNAMEK
jgi:hypothetical protein